MSLTSLAAISTLLSIGLGDNAPTPLPTSARAFIEEHCLACHDTASKTQGLDLTDAAVAWDDDRDFARWVHLFDRVALREMPPREVDQPTEDEQKPFLQWLARGLSDASQRRRGNDGRRILRRLNRIEFENTLRDLLEIPWLEVRNLLPDDGRADGMSKSAAALDVSPILIAKYGEAVDKALAAAVATWSVPPEVERKTYYANQQYDFKILLAGGDAVMLTADRQYDASRFPMPAATNAGGQYPAKNWFFGGRYADLREAEIAGVFDRGATVGMTRTFGEAFAGRFEFAPVHPGRYEITVSAWSYWWDRGKVKPAPRSGSVGVYVGSRLIGFVDAPSLKPTSTTLTVALEPTDENHLRLAGTSFLDAHVYFSQHQIKGYTGPGVAIDHVTVSGPLLDMWPPASHQRLFGGLPVVAQHTLGSNVPRLARDRPFRQARGATNGPGRLIPGLTVSEDWPSDARRLLRAFLPRAFRRPVDAAEVERYAALVDIRAREKKVTFEDAMLSAYRTALLSPDFLFLAEPSRELDSFSIANRLSYLLWNSCPDDMLLAAARQGLLLTSQGRRSEFQRLLANPRAERFFRDFPDQWLDLRDFDLTSPDRTLYPEFQPDLAEAIRREPAEHLGYAFRHRLRTSELLWTPINLVNQRLAEHYGIADVSGVGFRRVDVDQSKQTRGGLLTMAAVLKVTANGTTTSPVKRGAWVMKKIWGRPPQPPPPDIPAVEPDVRGATTIRAQLAAHQQQTACASCHAWFDPPGFALERYDVIGGYRADYRASEGKKGPDVVRLFPSYLGPNREFTSHVHFRVGQPVDSRGELRDGRRFEDLRGYLELQRPHLPSFTRHLTSELVHYATGAIVEFCDRTAVDTIIERAGGPDAPLVDLLLEIVDSPLFLEK